MEFSGTKLKREYYGRNDVASPVKYLGPYFHVSIELLFCYRKRPDQTWVQCDSCLKWRKLPDGIDQLPEKWYCSNNPDPQFRYHIVGSTLFWKGRKYCSRCMNRHWWHVIPMWFFWLEIVTFQKNLKMKMWCIPLTKKPTKRSECCMNVCGRIKPRSSTVLCLQHQLMHL